ncbi:hypothetical protein SETIT_6G079700v2 [Setaria italica]|uniref:RING-type domain-containing protein n=1 Tax=Setaria italica TaxID=4555 RepID=A0A368RJ73_SETIT|nr:hypothetical protein SETIT_6G079700v2 [Setaria italica]RCV30255.1 hypothetical protein SETIT_6G079700v2 [Setaria italica]
MAATVMGTGMGMPCSRCRPVCFGGMGHGQAIFTAECSHTFHLRCAPGSAVCPVCGARWSDTPAAAGGGGSSYDDDEPVEPPPAHAEISGGGNRNAATGGGLLVLKTYCEYPALSMAAGRDGFAVLVHAKAPAAVAAAAEAASARAPLDLVTVLDVSTSMSGEKLALVKRAMGFVIDNLGAGDRLSVVAFDSDAPSSRTDAPTSAAASTRPPRCSTAAGGDRCEPMHAFGFGTDHDAAAMHGISEVTGGTFSFIENHAATQDAFAQCVGGLLPLRR